MSTAYERAVESLRLVSREMDVAGVPATDLVMATVAVNEMEAEISEYRVAMWEALGVLAADPADKVKLVVTAGSAAGILRSALDAREGRG